MKFFLFWGVFFQVQDETCDKIFYEKQEDFRILIIFFSKAWVFCTFFHVVYSCDEHVPVQNLGNFSKKKIAFVCLKSVLISKNFAEAIFFSYKKETNYFDPFWNL